MSRSMNLSKLKEDLATAITIVDLNERTVEMGRIMRDMLNMLSEDDRSRDAIRREASFPTRPPGSGSDW